MKRVGIYAGSFDPPTKGHEWMMKVGAGMFDELLVVLAVNPEKRGFLTMERRAALLREMASEAGDNVRVEVMAHGFLVEYARRMGAGYLLRGVRNGADLEYEKTMARMNAAMEPAVQTVFLMPPAELDGVSSSLVRGFVGEPGWERWAAACVPAVVLAAMKEDLS